MKIKTLLYCTKANPYLYKSLSRKGLYITERNKLNGVMRGNELNGKIVCECEVDTEEIKSYHCDGLYTTKSLDSLEILKHSCLKLEELDEYLMKGRDITDYDTIFGYALHLSNIKVFDKPRELSLYSSSSEEYRPIKKAPQNMCNAYYDEGTKHYILISVRPEWLCKILNGEKTIEVRRVVLKGMVD
jgi:predicted transcriptional regulator